MITVVIADDHAIVREGVRRILEEDGEIRVIGEAGDGHEAVRLAQELWPDVVLLDYAMPGLDGFEASRQILVNRPKARIVVLTMHGNEEYAVRLLQLGVKGFVLKASRPDELPRAVKKAAADGVFISPAILEAIATRVIQPSENPLSLLSLRELQVLVQLALGSTTKEVAETLHLSPSTVETYRARLLEKLGLRNNSDLTRFALRHKLIANL